MAHTQGVRSRRLHTAIVGLLILAGLLLPSRAGADEPALEDLPPVISNGFVSPGNLPSAGGTVAIQVDVSDDVGVTTVSAEVFSTLGTWQGVALSPISIDSTGSGTYGGSFEVPPNFSDSPVGYQVEVGAFDTNEAWSTGYAGDVEVEGVPPFDEPPYVSDAIVEPRQLPPSGGEVSIGVTASDSRGVNEVSAAVFLPGGTSYYVPLEPVSFSAFEGVLTLPPNSGSTALQYRVEFFASDDIGQQTRLDGGLITVAAPPAQLGRIVVRPDSHAFGCVKLGHTAKKTFLLRYRSPRSAAPIEVVPSVSGAPFSVQGLGRIGTALRLAPGRIEVFRVKFTPTTTGLQTGLLTISRSDGGADIVVPLSGRGTAKRRVGCA